MARTIRTKVYKFNELNEDAKQKAIEGMRNINVDFNQWDEPIIEGTKEDLREAGYMGAEVFYSGFSSQGDGACFTCAQIDFYKFMNGKYAAYAEDLNCAITHNYRYYFSTSTTVNLATATNNIPDDLYNDIENDIKEERERVGNKIYKDLEQYFDELQTDEAIAETIEANEYEFTSDGRRF